jgi:LysM repeat protein
MTESTVSSLLSARFRAVAIAVAVGVVAGGCSDDSTDSADSSPASTASDSSSPAPGNAYVVVAGDTLSGIAAAFGLTLDELIAANGWSDGPGHAIFPGDVIELPADAASVPTTTSATTSTTRPASPGGGTTTTSPAGEPGGGGYIDTGLPFAGPDRATTDPIVEPLPDGVYWAEASGVVSGGATIEFTLRQRLSGEDCLEQFPTSTLNCIDDGYVGDATAQASMSVDGTTASVISTPAGIPVAWEVTPAELARLVAGEPAAADAPEGFSYVPFPFIVTVRGGEIVAADQQFQS